MISLFKKSNTIIEQIHHEFNNAGEILLQESKRILADLKIPNEEKVKRLQNFGFHSTGESINTEKIISDRKNKEKIAEAMEYFIVNYPHYKFITTDIAVKICKKYNLAIGDTRQYKGFVPDKNLKQIESFFENENEINTSFYEENYRYGNRKEISKEQYERGVKKRNEHREIDRSSHYDYSYTSRRRELKIAAPLKEMDTKGYKLSGSFFIRDVPDPVVLVPIEKNNIYFYCIVTAWGDEASDEMVVNQKMN